MAETLNPRHNPDVLSCLANLSNDEVFTPPSVANDMLDLLPEDLFRDKTVTFLDPVCKTGVFLREIARRLVKGLAEEIPDLQERVDHIFRNQLFGIAITEITALMSRRTLYCSKNPKGDKSLTSFDDASGNVRYESIAHTWKDGRCVFCGASEREYKRDEELETHAYEFIHTSHPERIFDMKFDVIIGNPPYQMSDGGNQSSAVPIYQKFVQQAKKLKPKYMSMIVPSRWFTGGRGLDSFRDEMLTDDRIRVIHDYTNSSELFPGVEVKGGICFFLWNRDERGLCSVYEHLGKEITHAERPLLEDGMETFIRNEKSISILRKVRAQGEDSFIDVLNGGRFFGFHTRVRWDDKTSGTIQTADGSGLFPIKASKSNNYNIKVYIAHGECWIQKESVLRNFEYVDQYKVIIPRSGNPGSTILGKPKVSEPGSCSSNTYVLATLPQNDNQKQIAENMVSYLTSNFLRFLVLLKTSTQDVPPKAYSFVPMQDFSKPWTDEELYEKYGLTEEEIAFIESMVRPMELTNGGD